MKTTHFKPSIILLKSASINFCGVFFFILRSSYHFWPLCSIAHSTNSAGVSCAENFGLNLWQPTHRQNPLSISHLTEKHLLPWKWWAFSIFSLPHTSQLPDCLILFDQAVSLYIWILIINAIISWLVAFNILNTSNRFVYSILDISYRLTAPPLNYIRRFLPNLGSIDISPVILILALIFLRNLIFEMFAPSLF